MAAYHIPYGKGNLDFDLPPGMHGTVVVSRDCSAPRCSRACHRPRAR